MRKVNLTKVQDVRRLLSRIINQVMTGEIETAKANCIGQLSNVLLRCLEQVELEKRIEEMERLLSDSSKGDYKLNELKNAFK